MTTGNANSDGTIEGHCNEYEVEALGDDRKPAAAI
jgi:hypothetical protein